MIDPALLQQLRDFLQQKSSELQVMAETLDPYMAEQFPSAAVGDSVIDILTDLEILETESAELRQLLEDVLP